MLTLDYKSGFEFGVFCEQYLPYSVNIPKLIWLNLPSGFVIAFGFQSGFLFTQVKLASYIVEYENLTFLNGLRSI